MHGGVTRDFRASCRRYGTPPYIVTGHGTPCPYEGGMARYEVHEFRAAMIADGIKAHEGK